MELGHLTDRGDLVVDSYRIRTLFPAIRVHEATRSFAILGQEIPMHPVAGVTVGVALHRHGWAREGEALLRPTPARLYRTGGSHLILGANWKALRPRRPGPFAVVHHPRGSGRPPIKRGSVVKPSDTAPFAVLIDGDSVKACFRTGTRVDLFAVEEKEFAPLVLGKLHATLDFPDPKAAEAFAAAGFPGARDLATLDAAVPVDVDRSRRVAWGRGAVAMTTMIAALYAGTLAATLYAFSAGRTDDLVRLVGSIFAGTVALAWSSELLYFDHRREFRDLLEKWPNVAYRRWASQATERAADFREQLRSLGVTLGPASMDLSALDRFLRGLPPEAYFRTFAMDAAAHAGEVMMRIVGPPVPYAWRWDSEYGDVVLAVDAADHWVAPVAIIAKVWGSKDPKTLDEWIWEQAAGIRGRLPAPDADGEEEDEGSEDEGDEA